MSNRYNDRLDILLTEYYKAEPDETFVFDPERRQPAPVLRLPVRRTLIAASLIFVSALSVTAFLLFSDKRPTPSPVSGLPYSAVSPSQRVDESYALGAESSAPPAAVTEDSSASTESESAAPTRNPSESISTEPTSVSQGTEAASEKPALPTQPSQSPTTAAEKPSTAQPPTQAPTQAPATESTQTREQPTQAPTLPPKPIWPTENEYHGDPGDPGSSSPDDPRFNIEVPIPLEALNGNYNVYCSIYDSGGSIVGDTDRYSSEHKAEISYISGSTAYVWYTSGDYELGDAQYTYEFYNSRGTVLDSGTFRL